jgi:hypothetical protein
MTGAAYLCQACSPRPHRHGGVGTETRQHSATALAGGAGYGSGDSGFSLAMSTEVDDELAWSGGM